MASLHIYGVLHRKAEILVNVAKIRMELLKVVNKYSLKKECNPKGEQFLLSKSKVFTIP